MATVDIPTTTPFGVPYRNAPGQQVPASPSPPDGGGYPDSRTGGPYHNPSGPSGRIPTGPTGTPGAGRGTDAQNDAFAILQAMLDQYGLGSLARWAWGELTAGKSPNEILLDMQQTDEFKARFPVIAERQAAGLTAVSPADVINYENSWSQMAHAAGLPAGMSDRQIAQQLMGQDVSLAEASSRINDGYLRVARAPATVRAAFDRHFGVGQGDSALASLFIDPDLALPDLEQAVSVAEVQGSGTPLGINLDWRTAADLAARGVTQQQAQQGFSQVASLAPLYRATIDEGGDFSAEVTGVGAVFGTDTFSERALNRRAKSRQAKYAGSNDVAATNQGVIGLGSAPSV